MRTSPAPWCLLLMLTLPACAWTRRENRPVWNSFEENLVPESPVGFAVALPVTVPLGLCAILTDTLVAHPLQVVDEAFDDSVDLWRNVDFEKAYYTECGFAPLRAVATPVWFLASFLGRSMFDFRSDEQAVAELAEREQRDRAATLEWLQRVAAGADRTLAATPPRVLDAELQAALGQALARGTALGRLRVYEQAAESWPGIVDWSAALGDRSAVVRFRILQILPAGVGIAAATWATLREDADEAVRALAERLHPK